MSAQRERPGTDYTGAVYGSLLAASVIAGTGPGAGAAPALSLALLLLATGLAFWTAHVYARLVGDRTRGAAWDWAELRSVGASERPLAEAAVPPAAAAFAGWILGLADSTIAWIALAVALAGQLGWGMAASLRVGARPPIVLMSGLVNLLLGLVIIALKVVMSH
ncbi:hypothetical protein [Actinomadura roseirufa]|uniref:hypothetical protein n=1 Tax=Actinomadura roseirufa TaxID=2094049 RepID=UPI001A955094|nr:hypothetical protein [Actinomadura roseirufa]